MAVLLNAMHHAEPVSLVDLAWWAGLLIAALRVRALALGAASPPLSGAPARIWGSPGWVLWDGVL